MITERGSASAKQINTFYNNWVDRPGAANMKVSFEYKGKENEIDLSFLQHQDQHFLGQIVIGIQDVDTCVTHLRAFALCCATASPFIFIFLIPKEKYCMGMSVYPHIFCGCHCDSPPFELTLRRH
jgi:hypothetical protein